MYLQERGPLWLATGISFHPVALEQQPELITGTRLAPLRKSARVSSHKPEQSGAYLGSSEAERLTVNQVVAGSIPALDANTLRG